jgi:ribosome maturation factor RimP
MATHESLAEAITPIVEGLGFRVVEFSAQNVKGRNHAMLVIYSPQGVGIDDCATVHKTVLPRLELLMDDRDVALQVASPGIDRVLKDWREFGVFIGRGIRILPNDRDEWIAGIVANVTEDTVEVTTGDEPVEVPFAAIRKAKLDYSQEVS